MRRSSYVVQPVHRSAVVGHSCEWAPQKELIWRARPAIRIAANQIDIGGFQIGRREHCPLHDRALEVGNLPTQLGNYPISVSFAQRFRPPAIARINLPGGIAFGTAGQFLQLQPENPLSLGRA
jgi:hypothetical protein